MLNENDTNIYEITMSTYHYKQKKKSEYISSLLSPAK